MDKISEVIKNKWFIQGLGIFALCLLIWFVGPLIAVAEHEILSGTASRLLVMLILLGLWLFYIFRVKYLSKKNNDAMVDALTTGEVEAETQVIGERFEQAVKEIGYNKNDRNRYHLYQKPWYIIIGPPGAGKTTLLVNSGLNLHQKGDGSNGAVKGIGGTRHCDWWFADEAIMIDTAGRFTTHDSNKDVDEAAWNKFMGLLKTYRKQRPINGVLIAVSVSDIIEKSEADRQQWGLTIRMRIEELIKQLGIRFPVYFMFTKCDLIEGFTPFFSEMNREQREQVWGETFVMDEENQNNFSVLDYMAGFEGLIERLSAQMLSQLNRERNIGARPAVMGFPAQMASLQEPIASFLRSVFADSYIQNGIFLRGVYFTSGTQEGMPLDRLLGKLLNDFKVPKSAANTRTNEGKSYFIHKLLKEVIIPEAELAGIDQKLVKRRLWWQRLAFGCAAIFLGATSTIWAISYKQNKQNILNTESLALQAQDQAFKGKMVGADFLGILPELNQLKRASEVFDNPEYQERAGLHQGERLGKQAKQAYLSALEKKLLPVVAARLQELIIYLSNLGETELTYEVLKAYLMYAGLNKRENVETDLELLSAISRADWNEMYKSDPKVVEQLLSHHQYLLEHGNLTISRNENDDKIIRYARVQLRKTPVSEQVYNSIKQQLLKEHSNDLSFVDLAGSLASDVFISRSGKNLEDIYIPGLFTKVGFYRNFLLQYKIQSQDYLNNNWVLGKHSVHAKEITEEDLEREVYERYYKDYIKTWEQLLKDLKVNPNRDLQQGMTTVESASSLNGPIALLVDMVSQETNLAMPLSANVDTQGAADAVGQVSGSAARTVSKIGRITRTAAKAGISTDLGETVTKAFSAYHRITDSKRNETLLERLMTESDRFYRFLQESIQDEFAQTPGLDAVKNRINRIGNDRFGNLKRRSNAMPADVKGWLDDIRELGWSMMVAKSRQELNRIWQNEVSGFYKKAIEGRYPVDPYSSIELEINDFAEFFRPKGVIDSFIQTHLLSFINTRGAQWREKNIDGQNLNLGSEMIRTLERAQQITELFFVGNGTQTSITFKMSPLDLDRSAKKFRFFFGNEMIESIHGPAIPKKMKWPSESDNESTRIQFVDKNDQKVADMTDGPWSLFKMLDKAQLEATSQRSVYHVTFNLKGMTARFMLRMDTEFNPLGDRLLQGFRLPQTL